MKETTYLNARTIARDYLCSKCHGPLIYEHLKNANVLKSCSIQCADRECKGEGFVTKAFVEARRREASADFIQAYANLNKVLGINSGKTAEELIKELGF